MVKNRKHRGRRHAHCQRPRIPFETPPLYSLCLASYYAPDESPDQIVRVTAVVTDLRTDQRVERIEASGDDDIDAFTDRVVALSKKYDVPIIQLSEPVPLERCGCGRCDRCGQGCGGYLDRVILRKDWLAMARAR